MKIIIGGDLVATSSNEELFASGDGEGLVGKEILAVLQRSDYRVFNLEVPLSEKNEMIMKYGACLKAKTVMVNGIKSLGADLLSLANNHIYDCGTEGVMTTMSALEQAGIGHVGAGVNQERARLPYIIAKDGITVGIYALAENEFAGASKDRAGANTIDYLTSFDEIKEVKSKCDYLIILYHGGKIGYQYPSPQLQRVCRKMIDVGGDCVILQHSHCIGCEEQYKKGRILYGQGNFLFDHAEDRNELWDEGLLVQLDVAGTDYQLEYIPVIRENNHVRLADNKTKEEIMGKFLARSEDIKKDGFVENHYSKFATKQMDKLYMDLHGSGLRHLWLCVARKLGQKPHYDKNHIMLVKDYIQCESIRELILQALTD